MTAGRPGFWHGQGVRPHTGIHHFKASTNQKIFYLFVLLFYIDSTMGNQVHNIYDIYAFYTKYSHIARFTTSAWVLAIVGKCVISETCRAFFFKNEVNKY